jgi:hypothetical protein
VLAAAAEDHVGHAARDVLRVLHGRDGAEEPVVGEGLVDPAGDQRGLDPVGVDGGDADPGGVVAPFDFLVETYKREKVPG